MKILLTLDIHEPVSQERINSESLLRLIWDQLQTTGIPTECFLEPAPSLNLATWLTQTSSIEKYLRGTPSPINTYDLIIGINLPPGAEALFTSLKIKTLIVRAIPLAPFSRVVLVRANFPLVEDFFTSLPNLKGLYHQKFLGKNTSFEERGWWLSNRFLINQGSLDTSILFIGTSFLQGERIRSGSIINLATYADSVMELLKSCPNFFYCSPRPLDYSELRFMKQLGANCPPLILPQLLDRDEFDFLVSIDSAFVPIAKAFNKKITILGTQPTWSTLQVRQFCNQEFMSQLFQATL